LSGVLYIPSRFNGPVDSGNGGYTCGLVSLLIDGIAEVTLRSPPPLDTELDVAHVPEGIEILDGSTLVATARTIDPWDVAVPPPPSIEAARTARDRYLGHSTHEFPTCFTCGPDRADGLAIFPGPTGDGVVASSWMAHDNLPSDDGLLRTEIVWAALDCAGAWSSARMQEGPVVLGRMAAMVFEPIPIGGEYIAYGWTESEEGRKSFAGTAISDADGRVLAVSKQTWIVVSR
jgi:hypothetical protein